MTNKVLSLTLSFLVTGVVVPRVEAQSFAAASTAPTADAIVVNENQNLLQQKQQQKQRQQQTTTTNLSGIGNPTVNTSTSTGVNATQSGGSIWWLNPAQLPTAATTPNKFDFTAGNKAVSCGLPAHAWGVSVYIAAYNSSSSSDKVSDYCKSVIEWVKNQSKQESKIREIRAFMEYLGQDEKAAIAADIINRLGKDAGLDLNINVQTKTRTIFVPYVPYAGGNVPPVHSRN